LAKFPDCGLRNEEGGFTDAFQSAFRNLKSAIKFTALAELGANPAEVRALRERAEAAQAYRQHPALMRLEELAALRELAENANARIYIGFDKHQSNADFGMRNAE
jgi:hypothetical protein